MSLQNLCDQISTVSNLMSISPKVEIQPFMGAKIPNKTRGVYIIVEGQDIIYVGKGEIPVRHGKHLTKIQGLAEQKNVPEPEGWLWLREHKKSKPEDWTFVTVTLNSYSDESLMESWLIRFLRPPVNNEIFKENLELGLIII